MDYRTTSQIKTHKPLIKDRIRGTLHRSDRSSIPAHQGAYQTMPKGGIRQRKWLQNATVQTPRLGLISRIKLMIMNMVYNVKGKSNKMITAVKYTHNSANGRY